MSAMKLLIGLTLSGFVLAIVGLIYGVLAVSVPHQDSTPAQVAVERAAVAISGWAMGGGAAMTLVGLAGMAFIGASRLVRSGS